MEESTFLVDYEASKNKDVMKNIQENLSLLLVQKSIQHILRLNNKDLKEYFDLRMLKILMNKEKNYVNIYKGSNIICIRFTDKEFFEQILNETIDHNILNLNLDINELINPKKIIIDKIPDYEFAWEYHTSSSTRQKQKFSPNYYFSNKDLAYTNEWLNKSPEGTEIIRYPEIIQVIRNIKDSGPNCIRQERLEIPIKTYYKNNETTFVLMKDLDVYKELFGGLNLSSESRDQTNLFTMFWNDEFNPNDYNYILFKVPTPTTVTKYELKKLDGGSELFPSSINKQDLFETSEKIEKKTKSKANKVK